MTKYKKLSALASRAVALFFSLLLLSESTAATVGSYGLKIPQQPAPTPSVPLNAEQQKLHQQGVKLVQEAQELKKKGTKEGYQQAINKYLQALKIYQELGLIRDEVEILVYIGGAYSAISEKQTAFDYLKQALEKSQQLKPIYRAGILGYIGTIYISIGELNDGISYLKQAESIYLKQKKLEQDALVVFASAYKSLAIGYNKKGEPKTSFYYLEKARKIYHDVLKDPVGEAGVLEDIGFIHFLRGELSKAFEKYNQALAIYDKSGNLAGHAQILQHIASLNRKLGKYNQAIKNLEQARKLLEQVKGTVLQQSFILIGIADVYSFLGDYQTAIKYYQQTKILSESAGDTTFLFLPYIKIATVYKLSGEYQKALDALDELSKIKFDNKEGQAVILQDKADIYGLQADYQKALEWYGKAIEIHRSIPSPKGEANTLQKIALLYKSLGDYESSIKNYNKALDTYKQIGDKPEQAIIYGFIGNVYETAGKYSESLKSYEQALLVLNKEDYISEIITLRGMARIYTSLKNYSKALEIAKQALALSQDKGKHEEIRSLSVLADVYLSNTDYKQALENYQKVLESSRRLGLLLEEADALSNIGITYNLSKQYQQAINTFNEELKLRRTLKNGTDEADALYFIAINQRKLGNLKAALPNIEAAIKIIENIRGNIKSSNLRTSYFATVQSYYKFKIDLLMELHKKEPSKGYNAQAIETSDRSRARGLVELLTEARANIRKGAKPELLAEERRLQALIDGKEKVRIEIVNTDKIKNPIFQANAEKLQKEIDELLSQQKQLETKIRESSPKYANLKYPQPLTLSQIQQQLDKDTLLLQYSLGKERSFLWVVSPNSLNTYELPKKAEIEKSAINLFCLISQNSSKPPSATNQENPCADIKTWRIDKAATELSQLILKDVKGKLGTKRLVIVADGALQYVPFAALADLNYQPSSTQVKEEKPKNPSCVGGGISNCQKNDSPVNRFDYQPLFVNHEIVNLPSASAIAIQRQEQRQAAPKALAILADPVYDATDTRVTSTRNKQLQKQDEIDLQLERSALRRSADTLGRKVWDPLPGTRTEADTIFKLVPDSKGLQVFDFAANYSWATSSTLNQFRILHFATHGFVNDANPELSGIVLSLVNEQGKDIRGYLRLADLFNLDYPADLIVLSACETGLGKEIQGEGLVGLTRGLMYAGAQRLVVSLWQVSDEGTAEFMQEFYKQMWQGRKSANEAMRATQLKMWQQEKWRDPNYWAAFTFLGEWR